MILLSFNITYKNNKSIILFLNLFYKFFDNFLKINKITYIKKFSILKSPHIFKKAQDQFEQRIKNKKIIIFCNFYEAILLLKHSSIIFQDLNINNIFYLEIYKPLFIKSFKTNYIKKKNKKEIIKKYICIFNFITIKKLYKK